MAARRGGEMVANGGGEGGMKWLFLAAGVMAVMAAPNGEEAGA